MKWYCIPAFVRDIGGASNPSASRPGVWICPDRGLVAFYRSSGSVMVLTTFAGVLPGAAANGARLDPQSTVYGGETWYSGAAGSLFRSVAAGGSWIFAPTSGGSTPTPHEPSQDEPFYVGSFNVSSSSSSTFSASGTASGTVTIARDWPRYEKTASTGTGLSPLGGTWSPRDGVSPDSLSIGSAGWLRSIGSLAFILPDGGGDAYAPASGAKIVPASSVDPADETGDYIFTDRKDLRLRSAPSAGSSQTVYTLDEGVYTSAGTFSAAAQKIVPLVVAPDYGTGSGASRLFFAEPALWQL